MEPVSPITEVALAHLVDRFYTRLRADPALGPIFNRAVADWPDHLQTLTAFWSSVMLTSGRYKGNPLAVHLRHAGAITPELFDRWLVLWAETTREILPPPAAGLLQAKAARIAESLKLALFHRPDMAAPSSRSPALPVRPPVPTAAEDPSCGR